MADKVYVKFIASKNKANRVGFVAAYNKKIADILVKRGQVEIIKAPEEVALAETVISQTKESAINKKRKDPDGVMVTPKAKSEDVV
jgi:hypothetical protein